MRPSPLPYHLTSQHMRTSPLTYHLTSQHMRTSPLSYQMTSWHMKTSPHSYHLMSQHMRTNRLSYHLTTFGQCIHFITKVHWAYKVQKFLNISLPWRGFELKPLHRQPGMLPSREL